MPFYRYEKNGLGPWNQKRTWDFIQNHKELIPHNDPKLAPMMASLDIVFKKRQGQVLFACESIEEINHWFNEEEKKLLAKDNYNLKQYQAQYFIKGTNQSIIFTNKEAYDEFCSYYYQTIQPMY